MYSHKCQKKRAGVNVNQVMAHRKWKETKLQPGRTAGPGNKLGCSLVSFHFLWAILCPQAVLSDLQCIQCRTWMLFMLKRTRRAFVGIHSKRWSREYPAIAHASKKIKGIKVRLLARIIFKLQMKTKIRFCRLILVIWSDFHTRSFTISYIIGGKETGGATGHDSWRSSIHTLPPTGVTHRSH